MTGSLGDDFSVRGEHLVSNPGTYSIHQQVPWLGVSSSTVVGFGPHLLCGGDCTPFGLQMRYEDWCWGWEGFWGSCRLVHFSMVLLAFLFWDVWYNVC